MKRRLAVGAGVLVVYLVLARIVAGLDPIASVTNAGLAGLLIVVRLGLLFVVPGWIVCGLLPARSG